MILLTRINISSSLKEDNEESGIIENMEGNVEDEILEDNFEDFQNEEFLIEGENLPDQDVQVNQLAIYLAEIEVYS